MQRLKTRPWLLRSNGAKSNATRTLIQQLWLIEDPLEKYQVKAYQEHTKECRKAQDDNSIPCERVGDVLKIVDEVKASASLSITEIYGKVQALYSGHKSAVRDSSIHQVLCFAVRLWLFLPLKSELRKSSQTLNQVVEASIKKHTSYGPHRDLGDDFCEKNLTRKAGIKLRWTSDLTRHLELQENRLFVFRHGAAMRAYASDSVMCAAYPPGVLMETQCTIDLLFPVSRDTLASRRKRICEKSCVDLEVGDLGDAGEPSRKLDSYEYWGARLAAIDDIYQASRPRGLKQWYYDRRNQDSFATFWFALSAFLLAFVFGLVSSITGVMQTWKAFHP